MTSEITSIADRKVSLSIARLAEEFGMSRSTVAKRLAHAGVPSAGNRNGYAVYGLREAAEALLDVRAYDREGNPDPRLLPPDKRNAWYASELRRLDTEMRTGQLVPAALLEFELSENAKSLVQFLETLPDQLERDVGISPEQVEAMHASIDRARQGLYDRLVENESPEATAHSESSEVV